jgi:hypothetical protein
VSIFVVAGALSLGDELSNVVGWLMMMMILDDVE